MAATGTRRGDGSQQKIALRAENNCMSLSLFRPFRLFVDFRNYIGGWIDFLRICAIFCRYWTCTFSGRNNQAIGPRVSAIFTLSKKIYFHLI